MRLGGIFGPLAGSDRRSLLGLILVWRGADWGSVFLMAALVKGANSTCNWSLGMKLEDRADPPYLEM